MTAQKNLLLEGLFSHPVYKFVCNIWKKLMPENYRDVGEEKPSEKKPKEATKVITNPTIH